MLYYLLGRIIVYLAFGVAAIYMIEKMRNKSLSFEMRILMALTGPAGFAVTLIIYILYKAFGSDKKEEQPKSE